jgi:hypothetical protein
MRGMTFKKALLLGGIFLLSTFILIQSSWGFDGEDQWGPDCRDDKGKPCHPPKIQSVDVDLESKEIIIHGENFDNTGDPVVTLGGKEIGVLSHTDGEIVATVEPADFPDTDYSLVVSTCCDSPCKDKYCKDKCSKCKDKHPKGKHCKDDQCKWVCKDRYSLTLAGSPGSPSPIRLTRVSEVVSLAGCSECVRPINRSAVCQGGLVTGGGFSCPTCIPIDLGITVHEPLENLSGWHIVGAYYGGNPAEFTIYAICTQGQ